MTFSTLANCLRWIRQKYIWNNNFRSKDPKMNLVTNNTIFFRHFKQGFSIFLEFFFIVVLYKSVTYNRLTDRCFFSLFTLDFNFFLFFQPWTRWAKNVLNRPSIVYKIFGPLNHELEHFSHCMITLLSRKLRYNSDYKNNFQKSYNRRQSKMVLRATFGSTL